MTERDKIARRIRALAAKTVENGCTEDEAIAAAQKLAEMLRQYNITLDEAMLRESPFSKAQEPQDDDLVGDRLWKVACAIAELTGARYWTSAAGVRPIVISFFGFAHEVDVAVYMLAICRRTMEDCRIKLERRYALVIPTRRRAKVLPFLDGMADSLAKRIRKLVPPVATGKGLIVLHRDLIDAAMKDAGLTTKQAHAPRSRDWEDTYEQGRKAGERVPLNRGLGSTDTSAKRLA